MASLKTTAANWAIARARWEGEPRCSYADVGDFLEISKQAVAKRAGKDGWQKKVDMHAIVDKAHAAADRASGKNAPRRSKGAAVVDARENLGPQASRAPTPEMLALAVEDAAVDVRAEILTRHRNEWPAVRNQVYKILKTPDLDGAKLAKIAAESLKLIQDGERKAWGIDAGGDDKPVRIVIERTEGVRSVR